MLREQYACAFAQMILGWRESWGAPSMPFGFVQLSSWTGNWGFDDLPCTENWCDKMCACTECLLLLVLLLVLTFLPSGAR